MHGCQEDVTRAPQPCRPQPLCWGLIAAARETKTVGCQRGGVVPIRLVTTIGYSTTTSAAWWCRSGYDDELISQA